MMTATGAQNDPAGNASKAELAFHKIEIMELASRFETTFDEGQLDEHMSTWGASVAFESPFMGNLYNPQEYRAALGRFTSKCKRMGARGI